MTKIKFCGLSRIQDIEAANLLFADYVGFVFAPKSRRYVTPEIAARLRQKLDDSIISVGVFTDEDPEMIVTLTESRIIGMVQLHGREDEEYISRLRMLTDCPIIKAFRIDTAEDIEAARNSNADFVLLDSGIGGTGTAFDWTLIRDIGRDFFLAGGLDSCNVGKAIAQYAPYAVDVSTGIETEGNKDKEKMAAFADAVRNNI